MASSGVTTNARPVSARPSKATDVAASFLSYTQPAQGAQRQPAGLSPHLQKLRPTSAQVAFHALSASLPAAPRSWQQRPPSSHESLASPRHSANAGQAMPTADALQLGASRRRHGASNGVRERDPTGFSVATSKARRPLSANPAPAESKRQLQRPFSVGVRDTDSVQGHFALTVMPGETKMQLSIPPAGLDRADSQDISTPRFFTSQHLQDPTPAAAAESHLGRPWSASSRPPRPMSAKTNRPVLASAGLDHEGSAAVLAPVAEVNDDAAPAAGLGAVSRHGRALESARIAALGQISTCDSRIQN